MSDYCKNPDCSICSAFRAVGMVALCPDLHRGPWGPAARKTADGKVFPLTRCAPLGGSRSNKESIDTGMNRLEFKVAGGLWTPLSDVLFEMIAQLRARRFIGCGCPSAKLVKINAKLRAQYLRTAPIS